MFNIFKQLKQLKMTKQDLEQQNGELMERLSKANDLQKQQSTQIDQLTRELYEAMARVRFLDGQVRMLELQNQSRDQFSDSDKNY
jgi:vacuolar-type H+-ATPase subunit D/Vma8